MRPATRPSFTLLLLALLTLAPAARATVQLDPQQVRWSGLRFTATKLMMSAQAHVEARIAPTDTVAARIVAAPGRPVPAGEAVLELVYRASGFGRTSVTTLWADPASGATLQQIQQDQEGRLRERTYRYTDTGAYHYTRRPATGHEESLRPSQWTDRSEGLRAFPAAAHSKPVSSPTVLLWLAAGANLSHSGDQLEILTFSRRHVHRVTLKVTGTRPVDLDFTEKSRTGETRRRRERLEAIVLGIRGAPLEPADDGEPFELLGLRGDLELLLDPVTRAPLQLKGRVKVMGQVTIRLRELTLR